MTSNPYSGSGGGGGRAIDRVADALRAAGLTFKTSRAGGGVHIQASCPIHGADRNPSLSIDQHAGDNRVRMYCQTCADAAGEHDLVDAIGLRYDELWDEPGGECVWCHKRTIPDPATHELIHPRCADLRAGRPARPGSVSRLPAPKAVPARPGRLPARVTKDWPQLKQLGRRRPVATYEHETLDADGVLTVVGRSVRTEATYQLVAEDGTHTVETRKGMHLEHPDPAGPDGWAPRLPDAAQVPLWRPAEVATAIADRVEVWLAEGHKDAARLVDAGLVATTNINGAGNFNEHHAEQLRGARVVVVCDRDLAGWRRGLKCARLLDGIAATVRIVLPATPALKSDAYDHLEQGYTVDEFVPITVAELETMVLVGESETLLSNLESMPREIMARQHRAAAAGDDQARASETEAADRWAVEAGRFLVRLGQHRTQLADHPAHTAEQLATVDAVIVAAADITVEAHRACELPLPDEVNLVLAAGDDPVPDNTTDLSTRLPAAVPTPEYRIAMSGRAEWAYSLGDGDTERAVYHRATANHVWTRIGPLPHVQARLIRRDASDDKCGMDYLIGLTEDSPHITVTPRMLGDGSWANQLGVPLSSDPQVVRAVATAVIYHADADVEAHEATARLDPDGRIQLPPKLPSGWLETSPAGREKALQAWRTIAAEATPVMAHTIAASAFAPFLRDVGTQPHVISLTSGKGAGKTLTLQLAAAVWGCPLGDQTDLFDNWNTTAKGTPLILGALRMLPAFRDEAGMAGLTSTDWGVLLYTLTQGASRTRGTRDGGGMRTASWKGILFATGNGEILAGAQGGAFDGLDRRVIDFSYPAFTTDRAHAKRLYSEGGGLLADCYGHLGQMIIDSYTLGRVRDLLAAANRWLAVPEGKTAQDVRDLMRTHVAGAMMLDELLGTGDLITTKTVAHAESYLEDLADVTDGDRVLEALLESMATSPSSWPTRDQYGELTRPWDEDNRGAPLPKGGINAGKVLGVRIEDTQEVWAFTEQFRLLTGDLNLRVGLAELENRGIFWRSHQKRTSREQRTQKAFGPIRKNVYIFRLNRLPDDSDPAAVQRPPDIDDRPSSDTATGPVEQLVLIDGDRGQITGSDPQDHGSITGGITGSKQPLTRDITGITGKMTKSTHDVGASGRAHEKTPPPAPDTPAEPTSEPTAGPASRAAEYTPERTAGWTMEQLEAALSTAWEDPDAVDALEQLIDAREAADREFQARQAQTGVARADAAGATLPEDRPNGPELQAAGTSPRSGVAGLAPDHRLRPAGSPGREPADREPADGGSDPGSVVRPGIVPSAPLRQPGDPRFVAPAAVLDGTTLHLPDGRRHTWTARHLGDLAVLAHEQTGLRLGWGGGDALPDQGQLWLYPDAIATLGLPERMDLPEKAYFDDERNAALQALYAPLKDHPAVTGALADGWELQQSRLDAWTRLRHPDLLPGGAILVFLPWWRMAGVPLLDGEPDPALLADRLHAFARATGVAYRVNSGITGLALIDHTRPPRRSPNEPQGRTVRMVRGEAAPLPPFLYDQSDQRFSSIETDYLWWRLWEPTPGSSRHALLPSETGQRYVHGYDRGASHLGGWHVDLGVDGLAHLGDDAVWNGKTSQAGIWLVDLWDWTEWGLPDPAVALNARVDGGRVWVTTPTLAQLKLHGITPTIAEAWVWDRSNRYLDLAAKILADARKHPDPLIVKTIKDVYTRTNGKIGEPRRWPTQQHLNRRDWYFTIVAQSRFAIDLTLTKINRETGTMPLAVDHDAVFFASDHPDPVAGWPGDPSKLGTGVGQWKPIGSAHLAEWGPAHLTEGKFQPGQPVRRGWRYKEAADDLTTPGAWRARHQQRGER